MSEVIVAKAGGTSNATSEAVEQSLRWAEQADVFVVSAPGKISGSDGPKVTDLLLESHQQYMANGDVESAITDGITERFQAIANGLGSATVSSTWVDSISPRVQEAASHSEHAASMLGERLQAEIYRSLGFTLLDPGRAPHDLGSDPDAWRNWLESTFVKGTKYVLPGNTTRVAGQLVTFDRGGSDISGGLAAYGVRADLNLNLTDGAAMSADPRLIGNKRVQPISHMLYAEARELGRNGTGLVHPAAMVPLMRGDIPTEIRSTFVPNQPPTLLDNDVRHAKHRMGNVIALSLMRDVAIHSIYEPGMAEAIGRLAEYDTSLASRGVAIVDAQGNGVDGQKYFTEGRHADLAKRALQDVIRHGTVETKSNVDLITMVGYELNYRLVDTIFELVVNGGINAKKWQQQGHDLSHGQHSLRISVDHEDSTTVFDQLHALHIEQRHSR